MTFEFTPGDGSPPITGEIEEEIGRKFLKDLHEKVVHQFVWNESEARGWAELNAIGKDKP
jgi:hypothetical protein